LARAGAGEKAGKRGYGRKHAGREITKCDFAAVTGAAGQGVAEHQARDGLIGNIVSGSVPVRAGLAEAGNRDIDDARIDRRYLVRPEAEPFHRARTEAFQKDIGRSDKVPQRLAAAFALQVKAD